MTHNDTHSLRGGHLANPAKLLIASGVLSLQSQPLGKKLITSSDSPA
jgi:hypothetical protein